jgi:hypothetical protein
MSTRLCYGRRVTDRTRPRRPASLTRRTLDVLLFSVALWALMWLWTGAA